MSKFKIGDKVKIIGNTYSSINQIGDIGIILDTIIARSLIKVHSQIPLRSNDDNWAYESDIELYVEESVLPEKWAIRQNSQIINDWLTKNSSRSHIYRSLSGNDFVHFPDISGFHLLPTVRNDYTEITLEQFKKYVLKEETIQLPKVIETTNIITAIECADGNIFKVGDLVKTIPFENSTWYDITTINSIEIKDNDIIFNNFINSNIVKHHIPYP